jgi:hypothetical protein
MLAGYEAMAMIRKGQVRNIGGNDIRARQSPSPDCSSWPPETSSHLLADVTQTLCNRTRAAGIGWQEEVHAQPPEPALQMRS